MNQVTFYELSISPLEKVLPKILEKIYEQGQRAIIFFDNEEQMKNFNSSLWTFSTLAFLPHGCDLDNWETAEDHPIWLSLSLENKNQADVGIMTYGEIIPKNLNFKRTIDIFSASLPAASNRFHHYKSQGIQAVYWEQVADGKWNSKEI